MEIVMKPIGTIRSPYTEPGRGGIPRQSIYDNETTAVIELEPEFAEGASNIAPGTYGVILFNFHRSEGYSLKARPHGTGEAVGVFSTRSPRRPNGIGMSVVKFTKNDGTRLEFVGVDMLDGTPVLDIKPYVKTPEEGC